MTRHRRLPVPPGVPGCIAAVLAFGAADSYLTAEPGCGTALLAAALALWACAGWSWHRRRAMRAEMTRRAVKLHLEWRSQARWTPEDQRWLAGVGASLPLTDGKGRQP